MSYQYTATVSKASRNYTTAAITARFFRGDNAPMAYSDNIKRLRQAAKLTQAQLAEKVNVEQPTVQRWESGKRKPSIDDLEGVAGALGVSLSELVAINNLRPLGPQLYVKGAVAAGNWLEAYEWEPDAWQAFTGRADITAKLEHRFGLRVVGDSMDQIYPDGTIVECVSAFGHIELSPGKKVVLVRKRADLTVEATVKEYVEIDGKPWFVPRSSNPMHSAIDPSADDDSIIETRIAAIVVASVRPE